jgi:hypothetical protein
MYEPIIYGNANKKLVIVIVLGKWKPYILKFELYTLYSYHEFCFDKYWSFEPTRKITCANLKLREQVSPNWMREFKAERKWVYDANFNTSKVYNTWIYDGFETPNHIFYDTLSQEAGSAVVILNSVSIHACELQYNISECNYFYKFHLHYSLVFIDYNRSTTNNYMSKV